MTVCVTAFDRSVSNQSRPLASRGFFIDCVLEVTLMLVSNQSRPLASRGSRRRSDLLNCSRVSNQSRPLASRGRLQGGHG